MIVLAVLDASKYGSSQLAPILVPYRFQIYHDVVELRVFFFVDAFQIRTRRILMPSVLDRNSLSGLSILENRS